MRLLTSFTAIALALGLVQCPSRIATAESRLPDQTATTRATTPPRLTTIAQAIWPATKSFRPGVSVLFEITIDTTGAVAEAKVLESAEVEFDEAAKAAVLASQFEPARRGAEPISVRIRYRYEFSLPTQAVAPESAEPAEPAATTAESTARARPAELEPDATTTRSGPPRPAATASPEPPTEEGYVAVAQIVAPSREVTRHSVGQADLTKIPGTSGDALRAIEVMPGVARTSISSGDPILRGAAWHESRSYVAGATVPLLYHFGGVKSAFNSRFLSRVDLYPGNYGASYGRAVGGVVSAKLRDPARDRFHALTDLSVIDSTAVVEAPLGRKAAVALGARRSNIDYFYSILAPKSSFNVISAPSYYDYQGLGWFEVNPKHQLRLLAYGSRDALELLFANPSDFDPALRDKVNFAIAYHRIQASVDSQWSARLTQQIQLTLGYTQMRQMLGNTRAEMSEYDLMSRGEWNYRASSALRINVGYDIEMLTMQGYFVGARPPQAEGEVMNGGMSTEQVIDLSALSRINAARPAGYAEVEWHPMVPLSVVPGIRIDHYSDQGAWTLNPRISSRYDLAERFTLKWGIGTYSQNPQYYELIKNLGNPALRPYHALHYSAGFEHRPTDSLSWGIDGFYKRLHGRIVSTPGGQPPGFANDGVGRVYGAELFARYQGTRLRAWLAYSLSRSERQDRRDPWRLFEKDQTHVLAATANYQLGRGWEVGGRLRLTSGNPYTPVQAGVYDANIDAYRPVNARPFSARNPMFQQLDLRAEKSWHFTDWRLACYLDIQNVYNAKNAEGFDYSYDYGQRQSIPGLSILPNIGVRGEI